MKHSFLITAAALLVTAAIVSGLSAAFGGTETPNNENESLSAAAAAVKSGCESSPGEDKMFLKTYDGKLALFLGDGRYPAKVYDLLVRSLPVEDQLLLKSGIEVSSDGELKRLLEDFLS